MCAQPRLHRHALCPCGSARTLAACCLPWEEAFQRLVGRLLTFADTPPVRRYEAEAAAFFWNIQGAVRPGKGLGPEGGVRFLEWFLCDYAPRRGEGTFLAAFADVAVGLSPQEEHLLLASLITPVRAYEVTETVGAGIMVTDLLTGGQYAVGSIGLPYRPIRSDLLICRLLHLVRLSRPGASLLVLPTACREELLVYLRTAYRVVRPARHVSLEDFLDGSAHLYQHFFLARGRNLGGRAVESLRFSAFAPGRVIYAGEDFSRMRAALDRQPELEKGEAAGDEIRYAYIDPDRAVTRAAVVARPGRLELRADSREDLAAARILIETCLRGLIHPVEERASPTAESLGDEIRLPGARMCGASFYARLQDTWADTPNLWLDNRTPRDAVQFRAARQQVMWLLANLEREMVRQKRLGRAWADLTPVRGQLCLPPAASEHLTG